MAATVDAPVPTVTYLGDGRALRVADPRMTVLELAIDQKIPHFRECGGHGRCTTCRIRIVDGIENVLPRTPCEVKVADALHWDRFTRLACQTRVCGDVSVESLIRSCADVARVQVEESSVAQPQEKTLAVLFCDIRDFTPFVEKNLAYDVLHILNRFFKAVGNAILMNNGVIHQYVGDQIVGLFGLGGDAAEKSCLDALRAGFGMLATVDELNTELAKEFSMTLEIGIGAHCGPLIAGMVGHPSHRQFSVIGDAMNIASRIEGANKMFGTRYLISESLFDHLPQVPLQMRRTQAVLKGRHGPVKLVEPIGFGSPDGTLLVQSTIGILMEQQQRFTQALYRRLFERLPRAKGLFRGDMASQGQMLAHMLQFLVYAMGRPETMRLGLRELGRRHAGYGVAAADYPFFRQAFLEAARTVLGDRGTPQVEKAWADTLDMIIVAMLDPPEAPASG